MCLVVSQVKFPSKMSEECRNFVDWCLKRNPEDRPSVKELLEHSWIKLHQVGGTIKGKTAAIDAMIQSLWSA